MIPPYSDPAVAMLARHRQERHLPARPATPQHEDVMADVNNTYKRR
jgi:hypothetical protein